MSACACWVTFAAVSVVWGMPYLFIKVAVDDGVSPAFLSFVRVALAAAILLPIAWRTGALRGLRAKLAPIAAFALLEVVDPVPAHRVRRAARRLVAGGDHHRRAAAHDRAARDPLRRRRSASTARASSACSSASAASSCCSASTCRAAPTSCSARWRSSLATVGYAIGPMIIKRYAAPTSRPDRPDGASRSRSPRSCSRRPRCCPRRPRCPPATRSPRWSCSASCARRWRSSCGSRSSPRSGPSRASIITYVNPVVAVALGVTLLGESLTASAVAGLLLILAGSWLSTGGRPPPGLATAIARVRRRRARRRRRPRARRRAWRPARPAGGCSSARPCPGRRATPRAGGRRAGPSRAPGERRWTPHRR